MNEFDKIKYNNEYNKRNYADIRFKIKASLFEKAQTLAMQKGFNTLNAYAKFLLENELDKNQVSINQHIEIKGGNVANIGNVKNQTINN